MRLGTIAAALGALLFAAYDAQAAPAVNLKGAMQSPAGSVDLVRQGGGGKGGPGIRAGGGGPKFSGKAGGPKMSGPRGGPNMGAYNGGPKMGAYKGGKGYAGKGPPGGDWARGGKNGGYAWKGNKHRHYRYLYPSIGLGLAYGAYNYGDECGWLWRRAQATSSPYWWQRYEECRYYN
ncbi:hypothetical protein [Methyloceanibacter sp.]|jgi:hypothetical protein|uniref:hypothetical protein n=1 Tax=Methyloceanibacter sp. TaxID=1965321 RepID=UPI002B5CD8A0|nr:hypothetical protein [Methyloceanibacter sp.]